MVDGGRHAVADERFAIPHGSRLGRAPVPAEALGRGTVAVLQLLARPGQILRLVAIRVIRKAERHRSEEHTSELQSLMRISYAVFCLKKKHTLHVHEKY